MAAKTQQPIQQSTQTTLLRSVQPLIGRSEKEVLWLLYRLCPEHSTAVKISANDAAKMLALGGSTVRKAFRRLEAIGFLVRTMNVGKRGTEGNSYIVQWNELEIAADAGRVVEMTDEKIIAARDASGRFRRSRDGLDALTVYAGEDQESLFGTKDEGAVELTAPARSIRPPRHGRIDRPGTVELTEPTISCSHSITPMTPPPISKPRPTLIDAEWLVVVDELKIFGCWEETARRCAAEARQRGLTPQTVSGLIRFAARKVIERTPDGRPFAQWVMPQPDYLDGASPPKNAVYLWGPPMLVYRIGKHEPAWGIASNWLVNTKFKAAYDEAQRRLPTANGVREPTGQNRADAQAAATNERLAKREQLRLEAEALEAAHGAAIEALSLSESLALLPRFLRSNPKADPRLDRLNRLQILRAFAASLKSEASHREAT